MRSVFYAVSALFLFAGTLTAQNKGYSIKGKITGLQDTVYLGYHYGDKQYLKDTALVDAQGRFIFEGTEKLDGGIYLIVLPEKNYFEMIVGDDQHFSFETDKADLVGKMTIKDSEENRIFFEYLSFISPRGQKMESLRTQYEEAMENDSVAAGKIREQMISIDKEVSDFKDKIAREHPTLFVGKMFLAMKDPEVPPVPPGVADTNQFKYQYYRSHFFDLIDFSDDRIVRSPVYHNKINQYMTTLVPQIPDSVNKAADYLLGKAKASNELFKYTLWYITNHYQNSKTMGMDAVFYHMVRNYYEKGEAWWVDTATVSKMVDRANKIEHNRIGLTAREIVGQDTTGKTVRLSTVSAPFTILYFWDSDCGHCKKVTPVVLEEYHKWKDKGVKVFAVNVEQEKDEWKKYVKENNLDWINAIDVEHKSYFRFFYDIYSTPVIYILDQNKKIIVKRIGAEQISEVLEMEFQKLGNEE